MHWILVRKWNLGNPALILLGWTAFALFFASKSYIEQVYYNRSANWQGELVAWLICGYSWAMVTPPILLLARRFPFRRENWRGALSVHIPASIFLSLAALAIFAAVSKLFGENYPFERFQRLVVGEIHSSVVIYFVVLGVDHVLGYFLKTRRRTFVEIANGDLIDKTETLKSGQNSFETLPLSETKDPNFGRVAYAERFSIKENGRIVIVDISEINVITSEGNYVKLRTNRKSYLFRETMKGMERKLDPHIFTRVRRSVIVRLDQVVELHPLFNGEFEIVLKNGLKISSSRRYKKNLNTHFKT